MFGNIPEIVLFFIRRNGCSTRQVFIDQSLQAETNEKIKKFFRLFFSIT